MLRPCKVRSFLGVTILRTQHLYSLYKTLIMIGHNYYMIKSIFLCSEGSYEIFGIPAHYKHSDPYYDENRWKTLGPLSPLVRTVAGCVTNRKFAILTQWYTHVLMHEMGHAFADKLLGGKPTITIYINGHGDTLTNGSGSNFLMNGPDGRIALGDHGSMARWKDTAVYVAGPIGNVAFSTLKLLAISLLKDRIPWPVSLALMSGSLLAIPGELLYAVDSAIGAVEGDFKCIARKGKVQLAAASVALISSIALGVFLTRKAYQF